MSTGTHYFFAASNSYDGFISYFDEIFSQKEYEKIYILKGGPGTGKSSFMKAVMKSLEEKHVKCEVVLCSSDPKSLDGLIVSKNSKKIAIVDGTSPHCMEPVYPGAVEKIINLGDFWNESLIKSYRDKITDISRVKKQFYTNAYQYLSVAKTCYDIVFDSMKKITSIDLSAVYELLEENSENNGNIKTRLYSAFGKDGFFELPLPFADDAKVVNVVGIYGTDYLFMEELFALIKERKLNAYVSPSPLSKSKFDNIFIENSNILFKAGKKGAYNNSSVIDTSKFIDIKELDSVRSKVETLYKEKEAMLWSATDEFKKAYEAHMELEKIYSAAMNFKKNKKKIEKVCEEIESVLTVPDITL